MQFSEIKENIRKNLDDAGITFYSLADIDDSVQDAYNEIVTQTRCIITVVNNIQYSANLVYYNLRIGLPDFLAVSAIYDHSSKKWLGDNVSLKTLDQSIRDWETWKGNPRWWVPVSFDYVAIVPHFGVPGHLFDLHYASTAPAVVNTHEPLIATDMHDLIEFYCSADLLEQAEEFGKASLYLEQYYPKLQIYADRVRNLAKMDLLRKK